jgi:putative flippase GtrA
VIAAKTLTKLAAGIDVREFARFFLTGVAATVGNMATVWVTRAYMPYDRALIAGIATGMVISFGLSKLFVFRSMTWRTTHWESLRFVLVYGVGALFYWCTSLVTGGVILPHFVPRPIAEMLGVIAGAGVMMVTSYLGHRFFTYRGVTRSRSGPIPDGRVWQSAEAD